jgi:hypothetical protein
VPNIRSNRIGVCWDMTIYWFVCVYLVLDSCRLELILMPFQVGLFQFPPRPRGTFTTLVKCLLANPGFVASISHAYNFISCRQSLCLSVCSFISS